MKRIEEVFDCWFESGSMPYAQYHYPFENKERFEKGFPCDFIGEGLDQTRGWFYTLHVLATALFNKPAYKNVIANGLILAEDGKKLSKRLKNYTEPNILINKSCVDAIRYFLLVSTPMGEDYRFSDRLVEETLRKTVILIGNIYSFYALYEKSINFNKDLKPADLENVLDKWIIAKFNILIKEVTEEMDNFDLTRAARPITDFINELSTWYLRRSRDRFKGDNQNDKACALATMHYILLNLAKICAPFLPFTAENIYQKLHGKKESVHLEDWPSVAPDLIKSELLEQMDVARKLIEQALAVRAEAGVKIRQPLSKLLVTKKSLPTEFLELIKEEVNVKEVEVVEKLPIDKEYKIGVDELYKVALDTKISADLQREGHVRELIRFINSLRKDLNLSLGDVVNVYYQTKDKNLLKAISEARKEIIKNTLSKDLIETKEKLNKNEQRDLEVNGLKIWIGIKKP